VVDGQRHMSRFATTRPETMIGGVRSGGEPRRTSDTRHLVGKEVELPLTGAHLPIIGRAHVAQGDFGTGCGQITAAARFQRTGEIGSSAHH